MPVCMWECVSNLIAQAELCPKQLFSCVVNIPAQASLLPLFFKFVALTMRLHCCVRVEEF